MTVIHFREGEREGKALNRKDRSEGMNLNRTREERRKKRYTEEMDKRCEKYEREERQQEWIN